MLKKSILVLCIDRDNDLYEKVKISGPVIGRKKNLEAATKLALADAEDPDGNAMFKAIAIYDELLQEHTAEVATLTGSKSLGFAADKEVSEQLERVLSEFHAESCVFVSDGSSDEEIMPIIRSRVKIDSVKVLVMKQAKELEKTYFVLLEKLKDPYYSRLIFGIPAVALLMFSLASYLHWGWQPVAALLGAYLLAKGLGIEEWVSNVFNNFDFSVERVSLMFYIVAIAMFLIFISFEYSAYSNAIYQGFSTAQIAAYLFDGLRLMPLLLSILLLIAGKMVDLVNEKRKFELPKYGLYAVSITLLWFILSTAAQWVLNIEPPYVSFTDFILAILISICVAYLSIYIMKKIKLDVLARMKLENKEVISEVGSYAGKIIGVDPQNSVLVIQSPFGQKYHLSFDSISSIGEKVIVRNY